MDEKKQNFAIDVKELILTQSGKSMGTETFVYEPVNIEEEAFGNLYIIGWLQNKRHELEFLPNLVASVMRREFYAVDGRTTEAHFESALRKANATLLDINKTNKDIIRDVHFCIANIVGEKIRLCIFGDMLALFHRNGEIVNMDQKSHRRGKTELFSEVITGDIAPGDTILLGTKTVIDLFSDKGLGKLLSLPLLEQSEIITKIYQKNAKETLLPDQALVLIGVEGALESPWLPFKKIGGEKKRIDASPATHERALGFFMSTAKKTQNAGTSLFHHARAIPTLSVEKRNARIFFGIFLTIIVCGSMYAMINAKFMILRSLEQRIEKAKAATDITAATELLETTQSDALALIPSLLTSSAAEVIFYTANTHLNAIHGIRTTPPSFVSRIQANSLAFQPTYIFDDDVFIYVFSQKPDTIAKIAKINGDQRLTFIPGNAGDFSIERILQKDNTFYLIDDTNKAAMLWNAKDNTREKIKRPTEKSTRNERITADARYTLENTTIVRTMTTNNEKTKYLLGQLPPLTDFTVSRDNTILYILAQNMVFSLPL